jgi:signal transduction histidine kinase
MKPVTKTAAPASGTELDTKPEDKLKPRVESGTHNTVARPSLTPEARATRFSELFASMINHDLRNALSAVSTAANLLEMRADSDKVAVPVGRIVLSAARMERMLAQLVDFARIEIDGALVLVREPIELDELVLGLIDDLPAPSKARVALTTAGDLQGQWDRDRITHLIATLLANALQHGAQEKPVRVHIQEEDREVCVEIENEGEIAPEVLETLFVPQHRKTREHVPSGLGLGLYVARRVASAHGGTLDVQCAGGRTCFSLRLPSHHIPVKPELLRA